MSETQIAAMAVVDQSRATARDLHPERSENWRDVWIMRTIHHQLNDGDVTGAPDFPDERGSDA